MARTRIPFERITLSVPETAEALGISLRHCKTLVKQGVIPTVRLGARVLVPVDELKAQFRDQLTTPAA